MNLINFNSLNLDVLKLICNQLMDNPKDLACFGVTCKKINALINQDPFKRLLHWKKSPFGSFFSFGKQLNKLYREVALATLQKEKQEIEQVIT